MCFIVNYNVPGWNHKIAMNVCWGTTRHDCKKSLYIIVLCNKSGTFSIRFLYYFSPDSLSGGVERSFRASTGGIHPRWSHGESHKWISHVDQIRCVSFWLNRHRFPSLWTIIISSSTSKSHNAFKQAGVLFTSFYEETGRREGISGCAVHQWYEHSSVGHWKGHLTSCVRHQCRQTGSNESVRSRREYHGMRWISPHRRLTHHLHAKHTVRAVAAVLHVAGIRFEVHWRHVLHAVSQSRHCSHMSHRSDCPGSSCVFRGVSLENWKAIQAWQPLCRHHKQYCVVSWFGEEEIVPGWSWYRSSDQIHWPWVSWNPPTLCVRHRWVPLCWMFWFREANDS